MPKKPPLILFVSTLSGPGNFLFSKNKEWLNSPFYYWSSNRPHWMFKNQIQGSLLHCNKNYPYLVTKIPQASLMHPWQWLWIYWCPFSTNVNSQWNPRCSNHYKKSNEQWNLWMLSSNNRKSPTNDPSGPRYTHHWRRRTPPRYLPCNCLICHPRNHSPNP